MNFCVLFCYFWIFDECECTIHLYHQLMSITWTYHDPHGSIGCFQHVPSASPTMQLGGREDSTRPAKQGFASQGWWIGIPEIISQGDTKFTINVYIYIYRIYIYMCEYKQMFLSRSFSLISSSILSESFDVPLTKPTISVKSAEDLFS